jgi:hypothetical protein
MLSRPIKLSRQNKAVIGTGVFFLVLAAILVYQPAPDLVASPELVEQMNEADYQVQRGRSQGAGKSVDIVGATLTEWSLHGEELSDTQRSDISLLGRDARILGATMSGQRVDLGKGHKSDWAGLRRRIEGTIAGD